MDEVDRKIVSQLQQDGRTTFEELSKIFGFSSMGVKKRFDKLVEKGIIKPILPIITYVDSVSRFKIFPTFLVFFFNNKFPLYLKVGKLFLDSHPKT